MQIYEYFISVYLVCDARPIFSNTSIETREPINGHTRIRELERKMKEQFGYEARILFFSLLNTKEIEKNLNNTCLSITDFMAVIEMSIDVRNLQAL